ncbi:putative transcription regulator [Acinetobacter phage vB_AbaM_Berthold]|uniref:Putative transcription regulator n=1 Tax=Acinetobacter phage vB_AbaM_Berthold TaxID=2686290 RepID=A0A6B9J6N7_9CAUD|nr:putative transcription regulator [Acinetobacter phage vB_AbaM_Berthold]QGZ15428.1 putative transcription regulator [Acinetobacter phage vB_AbaM_Berthold]
MNSLLCNHEFNFDAVLLSSPPKVRCTKCKTTASVDEAREYQLFSTPIPAITELEKREFWKACALAYLPNSGVLRGCVGVSSSAATIADNMVEHFVNRYGK